MTIRIEPGQRHPDRDIRIDLGDNEYRYVRRDQLLPLGLAIADFLQANGTKT